MISARSSAHLPDHLVGRDRLGAALDRPGARIVVVTGPAGSGKTVAVRQWAATTPDPPHPNALLDFSLRPRGRVHGVWQDNVQFEYRVLHAVEILS